MNGPEIPQDMQCFFGQGDQPVLVAFGVSNMDSHVDGIDIADLQRYSLAKSQAQRVDGEKEDPIAQLSRGGNQLMELLYGQNIGDPGGFGGLIRGMSSQVFFKTLE